MHNVFPLDFFYLCILVLPNEVINVHEAATNSDINLTTLFYFDVDSLLAELVDSFGLP